jgi:phosphatidyl-myo-inositol alpha-mannosyltransferase
LGSLRIGLICPYDLRRPGGVQQHIRELAHELSERGHYVRVLGPGERSWIRNRTLRFSGTQIDYNLAAWGPLRDWLEDERFDVLHYHTMWNPWLPLQVRMLARAAAVATFHDSPAHLRGAASGGGLAGDRRLRGASGGADPQRPAGGALLRRAVLGAA